jgi:NAD(P)H-dependent flavin oxidoreductase YrpB (nitropropane dioxygenase family)
LGGDEYTVDVDPRREGYPAGQAVGAIDTLVPAGDIVRTMVADAERVIAGLSSR